MELPEFVVSLYQASDQTLKYDPPCWQHFLDSMHGIGSATFWDQNVERELEKYNGIFYRKIYKDSVDGCEFIGTRPYVIFNTMEDMMEFILIWT